MAQRTVSIVVEVTGTEDATRQVRQMRSALDDFTSGGKDGLTQILRQSREVNQAMKEMQQSFGPRQQQKEMLGDLENFFRRILTGARTTGDVFKNIWKEVGDFFRRTLGEMAGALNLGGISGVLSGLGGGGGVLGALPSTAPFGNLMRQAGIGSLLGNSGLTLANLSIGSSNRTLSTTGGFLGGGLAGLGIGSALSGLGGTLGLLGAFGGPIGAVVGGLIGFFTGGGGKKKEHDAAIANQGFAQLAQILEDYNHFRRDYASAMDAANRIWSRMQTEWVRPESAPSQRPYFDAVLRSMQQTEDERNRRRQLMSLLPIPEFQTGGAVADNFARARGGGILSMLHPGEFVMNRQAVERLGVSALEGLNRGAAAGSFASGTQITLEPASAQTLGEMLKQNPQALEEGLLVVLRRGGPASRVLRQ